MIGVRKKVDRLIRGRLRARRSPRNEKVSARQLHTNLHEHYDIYGQDERWLVEIPKGRYLPVFHDRGIACVHNGGLQRTGKFIQRSQPIS